jgi:hypothetical protein
MSPEAILLFASSLFATLPLTHKQLSFVKSGSEMFVRTNCTKPLESLKSMKVWFLNFLLFEIQPYNSTTSLTFFKFNFPQ